MESVFTAISLSFFFFTILTMVTIVRDVFPLLHREDQASLRNYWTATGGFRTWWSRDGAIRKAWSQHFRSFPRSYKRVLFASILIALALSLMGYPVSLALRPR
jgi:hypothetical protein